MNPQKITHNYYEITFLLEMHSLGIIGNKFESRNERKKHLREEKKQFSIAFYQGDLTLYITNSQDIVVTTSQVICEEPFHSQNI